MFKAYKITVLILILHYDISWHILIRFVFIVEVCWFIFFFVVAFVVFLVVVVVVVFFYLDVMFRFILLFSRLKVHV